MWLAFWLRLPLLRLAELARHAGHQLSPREEASTPSPGCPHGAAEKHPQPALRLRVEVLEEGEGVVVRLRGRAGIAETNALEASLLSLAARRPTRVAFDLSELLFISSIAVGVLAAYHRAAVRAGARVSLRPDLFPAVREALTRAELIGLFEAVDGAKPFVGPGPPTEAPERPYPNVHDVEKACGVTWHQLIEGEPQLEALLWRARMAGADCRTFNDVDRVFGPLRNELSELLGFSGKHHWHPVLGGVGAYEVAYWKLYDAVAGLLPVRAPGADEAPKN